MNTEYELTVSDYLSIIKRHWVKMLIVIASILFVSVLIALLLKPVYLSKEIGRAHV